MENLYKGLSVASVPMMTLEAVNETISQNRSKIRQKILFSATNENQEKLLREKMKFLLSIKESLYSMPYSEILLLQHNLNRDIDNFIKEVYE